MQLTSARSIVSLIILLIALAIETLGLMTVTNVAFSTLLIVAIMMFFISLGADFYLSTRGSKATTIVFVIIGTLVLLLTFYLLRNYLPYNFLIIGMLSIALVITFVSVLLMGRDRLRPYERIFTYLSLAFLTAIFRLSYAFIAVYLTFIASRDNLMDQGKYSKLKRLVTYVSGTLILLYNAALIVLELLGIYKPKPNLFLVAVFVAVTVALAARNLLKHIPSGRLGRILYLMLPALIGIYAAGYTLYRISPEFAPIDGISKSLAALAAIVWGTSQVENVQERE